MIDFDTIYTLFGDDLPVHPSEFFNTANNPTLLADLKIYNTANKVLAYNIFKAKYKEFVSTKKVAEKTTAEKTTAEKLAALKAKSKVEKEIVTK